MKAVIEGLLFISGDEGLTLDELKNILEIDINDIKNLIKELYKDYQSNERGIKLELLGNHFKLTTKQEHKDYYEKHPEEDIEEYFSNLLREIEYTGRLAFEHGTVIESIYIHPFFII